MLGWRFPIRPADHDSRGAAATVQPRWRDRWKGSGSWRLGVWVAGPAAGGILADWGAEVEGAALLRFTDR